LATPVQTRLEERLITKTLFSPQGFSLDALQKVALALLVVLTVIGFAANFFSANWILLGITGLMLLLCGLMVWIIRLRTGMIWKVT